MATPFSWSDTLRACIPCFHNTISLSTSSSTESLSSPPQHNNFNEAVNTIPRARPDELNGLLRSSSDDEVDAISLLSTRRFGKKKKGKGKKKEIKVWGLSIFGKGAGGVKLDGGDDALYGGRRRGSEGSGERSTVSTSDTEAYLDAAPLDVDRIADLSRGMSGATSTSSAPPHPAPPPTALAPTSSAPTTKPPASSTPPTIPTPAPTPPPVAPASAASLTDLQKEKEEKRTKKQARRLARAHLASLHSAGAGDAEEFEGFPGSSLPPSLPLELGQEEGEFEGFPGSGPSVPLSPSPLSSSGRTRTRSGSAVSGSSGGAGVRAHRSVGSKLDLNHEEGDEEADLDGQVYARPSTRSVYGAGGGGSDSRSRTSASDAMGPLPFAAGGVVRMGGKMTGTTTTTTTTTSSTSTRSKSHRSQSSTTSFSLSNSNSVPASPSPLNPTSPPLSAPPGGHFPIGESTGEQREKKKKRREKNEDGTPRPRSKSKSKSSRAPSAFDFDESDIPPSPSLPSPYSPALSSPTFPSPHETNGFPSTGLSRPPTVGAGGESTGFPSTGLMSRSRSGSTIDAVGAYLLARRGDAEFEGY